MMLITTMQDKGHTCPVFQWSLSHIVQIPTWTKLAFYGPLESWLWDSPQTTEDESYNQFERDLN